MLSKPKRPRALILPPELETLDGSRGDQAMLLAVKRTLASAFDIYVLVTSEAASARAVHHGLRPFLCDAFPLDVDAIFAQVEPRLVLYLGADVIDGSYDADVPLQMLRCLDYAARRQIEAAVLGFSFSRHPDPDVLRELKQMDEGVSFFARDPTSYARFCDATGRAAHLVADTAFLLRPDGKGEEFAAVKRWRRSLGKDAIVLGLNLHFALFPDQQTARAYTAVVAATIERLSTEYNIAWLLLPHDARSYSGDLDCLAAIRQQLSDVVGDRVWLASDKLSCEELKAHVSLADGMITGRMHLAVAALSQGIATLCFAYKDKFEGLLEHFSLPPDLLIQEISLVDSSELYLHIERFLCARTSYESQIASALPRVERLSRRNFSKLHKSPTRGRCGEKPPRWAAGWWPFRAMTRFDQRRPGALVVAPAWVNCGSFEVFKSQVGALEDLGYETCFVAVPHFWMSRRDYTAHVGAYWRDAAGLASENVHVANYPRLLGAHKAARFDHANGSASQIIKDTKAASLLDVPWRVRWFCWTHRPLVVICNHYFNVPFVEKLGQRATGGGHFILETHDIQTNQIVNRNQGLADHLVRDALHDEVVVCSRASHLVNINGVEDDVFRKRLPSTPSHLVFPYIRRGADPIEATAERSFLIVAAANPPNAASLDWFLERVWQRYDGAGTLAIVGTIADAMQQSYPATFAKWQSLFVGKVKDLQPFYRSSAIVLIPAILGEGIAIKFAEAMAYRKRVLFSPLAIRGLPKSVVASFDDCVCHDADEFLAKLEGAEDIHTARPDDRSAAVYEQLFSWKGYVGAYRKLAVTNENKGMLPGRAGASAGEQDSAVLPPRSTSARRSAAIGRCRQGAIPSAEIPLDAARDGPASLIHTRVRSLYRRLAEQRMEPSEIIELEDWLDSEPHWLHEQLAAKRVTDRDIRPFGRLRASMGVILDVGAHWGYTTASIRFAGTDCSIIAFEAVRANASCLNLLKETDPQFDFRIVALSDRAYSVTLYSPVANGRPLTGLDSIDGVTLDEHHVVDAVRAIQGRFPDADDVDIELGAYRAEAQTLDSVLSAAGFRFPVDRVAAIKIDVEGHEGAVLRGAANLLAKHKPLMMIDVGVQSAVMPIVEAGGYRRAERLDDTLRLSDRCGFSHNHYFVHPQHFESYRAAGLLVGDC